jgi:NMD protein affecting ribosome stability and mRNA decay
VTFCVKCGVEIDNIINGLCIDCFLDGRKLMTLPHHVDLFTCANCGEVQIKDRWIQKDIDTAIEDAAINELMVIKEAKIIDVGVMKVEQDPVNFVVNVEAGLDISGCTAVDTASTTVRLKNTVCKRCSRQLGNYYESIVQIRSGAKELPQDLGREALTRVENYVDNQARNNRHIFITKIEIVQGGLDVYLSSISLGKAVAKDLSDTYCAETKESAKLVGQTDDGQDMYRITYLVRLPDFHVGDVVIFEGTHYKLQRVGSNGGKIIDLMNFRERSVRRSDMPLFKIHEKGNALRVATVISRSGSEIQVMDPRNYLTSDIRIPSESEIGEAVSVTEIDDVLYYVP